MMGNRIPEEFKDITSFRDKPDEYFVPGSKVKVIGNEKYVKYVQAKRYRWNDSMRECLNQILEVKCVDHDKGIKVQFKNKKTWIFDRASLGPVLENNAESILHSPILTEYNFNSPILTTSPETEMGGCSPMKTTNPITHDFKTTKSSNINKAAPETEMGESSPANPTIHEHSKTSNINKGDFVFICADEERFKKLQIEFGGYSERKMKGMPGQELLVRHASHLGVQVYWNEEVIYVNPELIELDVPREISQPTEVSVKEAKDYRVGDLVWLCSDVEKFEKLQHDRGGYSKHKMQDMPGQQVVVTHMSSFCIQVVWKDEDFSIHPNLIEIDPPEASIEKRNLWINPPEASIEKRNLWIKISELFEAIEKGDIGNLYNRLTTDLIDIKGPHGRTPMNSACCFGRMEVFNAMLDFKPDFNIYDDHGLLPVHNSIQYNHPHILRAILQEDPNAIQKLTEDGKTSLHIAVIERRKDAVEMLLKKEINVYIVDRAEKTALDYATDPEIRLIIEVGNTDSDFNCKQLSDISFCVKKSISTSRKISQLFSSNKPPTQSNIAQISKPSVIENECEICRDKSKNTTFRGCGHTACDECAEKLVVCHICNKLILSRHKIYL